jgi:hypothetical protein
VPSWSAIPVLMQAQHGPPLARQRHIVCRPCEIAQILIIFVTICNAGAKVRCYGAWPE